MKKNITIIVGLVFIFALVTSGWAEVIDFENSTIDVLADTTYQTDTPFFPGVLIQTIDNNSEVVTGWPVVVRAHQGNVTCNIPDLSDPGEVGGFDSRFCDPPGSSNTTKNYPVPSGLNSLSDISEGLPPSAGPQRKQDGFLVSFANPVSNFSVSFADWGDYFPNTNESFPSYIELISYNTQVSHP